MRFVQCAFNLAVSRITQRTCRGVVLRYRIVCGGVTVAVAALSEWFNASQPLNYDNLLKYDALLIWGANTFGAGIQDTLKKFNEVAGGGFVSGYVNDFQTFDYAVSTAQLSSAQLIAVHARRITYGIHSSLTSLSPF